VKYEIRMIHNIYKDISHDIHDCKIKIIIYFREARHLNTILMINYYSLENIKVTEVEV